MAEFIESMPAVVTNVSELDLRPLSAAVDLAAIVLAQVQQGDDLPERERQQHRQRMAFELFCSVLRLKNVMGQLRLTGGLYSNGPGLSIPWFAAVVGLRDALPDLCKAFTLPLPNNDADWRQNWPGASVLAVQQAAPLLQAFCDGWASAHLLDPPTGSGHMPHACGLIVDRLKRAVGREGVKKPVILTKATWNVFEAVLDAWPDRYRLDEFKERCREHQCNFTAHHDAQNRLNKRLKALKAHVEDRRLIVQ